MFISVLQTSTGTEPNRYPEVFDRARSVFPDAKTILSFGCSTGEELATLAEHWPDAEITGVDVLESARNTAKRNFPEHRILGPDDLGNERFDIIAAMSVLCRWPEVGSALPFALFAESAQLIDSHLKPGGMLVTFNTTYNPADVLIDYEVLDFQPKLDLPPTSKSRLIVMPRNPDGSASDAAHPVLFRKPGRSAVRRSSSLTVAPNHVSNRKGVTLTAPVNPIATDRQTLQQQLSLDDQKMAIVTDVLERYLRRIAESQEQVSELQKGLARVVLRVREMEQSTSWRLTGPLRELRRMFRTLKLM